GLWLKHETDRAERGQATVRAGHRQLHGIVDAGEPGREDVRLEAGGIEQIVLKQLARFARLGVGLERQDAVRAPSDPRELVLQRSREVSDIARGEDGSRVVREKWIRVARRRWLLRIRVAP